MCGICGIISLNTNTADAGLLRPMMLTIKHRGPDDEGVFSEGPVALGFVRLSIIDLSSSGHQPMLSTDERYVVIFNGEIYNYIELRNELSILGHCFKSLSDTEVLLASYQEWGEKCLDKFNGMWAFAIYDRIEKSLFFARDRFGVKPFYYTIDDDRFLFASEIPPILKLMSKKPTVDNQSLYDYLVFNRTDQTEATFFTGVKKLQHGHSLKLALNEVTSGGILSEVKPTKWYDLRANLKSPFQSAQEFRESLSSSIGLRLRSDVPVGVCLSGGLDSSGIVSILLKDFDKRDLNTFSAVYLKGQKGDESEFIDEYRKDIANMHFTSPSANSLYKDIQTFVRAHGEPIPSTSPYAQFKVMELAKNNVVVLLDGQGADEIFGGYHYFFGFYFKDLFSRFKWLLMLKEMIAYIKTHRSLYGIKTFAYFMLPERLKNKSRVAEKGYLDVGFVNSYSDGNSITGGLYSSGSIHEALLDHFEYKLEHLLKWEDRNSMWFSLESRVPFLDYRIVERTLSLPPEQLIRDGMTKHIFREAMKATLPEKIRIRKDKIGFETPEADWFRNDFFREFILKIIGSDSFNSRGLYQPCKIQELYSLHLQGKIDISKEIWKWIHLELWFREFID